MQRTNRIDDDFDHDDEDDADTDEWDDDDYDDFVAREFPDEAPTHPWSPHLSTRLRPIWLITAIVLLAFIALVWIL